VLQSGAPVSKAAEIAIYSIVKDSVFGALLIVTVILLVWLVRRVLSIQDLRVQDQKDMSDRLEKSQEKTSALIEKMTEAFTTFQSAVDKLNQTQELSREATADLASTVRSLKDTVDSVVRDAVRGPYRSSRSRSSLPAARPGSNPPKGG
jgi:high-affinity Fe2+/Pb2+ permease